MPRCSELHASQCPDRCTYPVKSSSEGTDALAQARDRVNVALDTLSDEMRTVVVMSIYQGFKYREIADVMGIPLGTVKTRMFHALRKLKDALKEAGARG